MPSLDIYAARQLLRVPAHATEREITVAYRRACLEKHPDKGGSKEAFQQLNEAFVLAKDAVVAPPPRPFHQPGPQAPAASQAAARSRETPTTSAHRAAPPPGPFAQTPDHASEVPTQQPRADGIPPPQHASLFAHLTLHSQFGKKTNKILHAALDQYFNRDRALPFSPWLPKSELRKIYTKDWAYAAKEKKTIAHQINFMIDDLGRQPTWSQERREDAIAIINFLKTIPPGN